MSKKTLGIVLALFLALTAVCGLAEQSYTAGTYTGEFTGMHGPITLEVTVDEGAILDAKMTEHMETPGMGDAAAAFVAEQIVANQSLDVDMLAGASITSRLALAGYTELLKEAGADVDALKAARERDYDKTTEFTADVVIVGGGGAGLSAAATALAEGASVALIEATDILGGNSLVVGGFMNAPILELQDHALPERSASMESLITAALEEEPVSDAHKALQDAVRADYEAYLETDKTLFDSANWFALQTWNGGDKLADIEIVKKLAGAAYDDMQWLISNGQEFRDNVVLGGGALYTRSRYAILPNGFGYITAIKAAIEKNNNGENLTIMTSTKAESLIVEDGKVVGVTATNKRTGETLTFRANNGVILSTGGFAGNVELRQKYCEGEKWPDLSAKVLTTNTSGVRGDGIFMAEAAGAQLVNMEQIQLLPYGDPWTGEVNDVIGGGNGSAIFINKEGKRFVREDGRRDDMSKAIIDQTDGLMYMFGNAKSYGVEQIGDAKTLGGQPVSFLLATNPQGYVSADTLEEMAEKLNVSYETLKGTLEAYNANVRAGTADEFGRVTYVDTLEPDEGPWVATARKPSAHHTMGGVRIDLQAHALDADGNPVPGLYCAGEITGVVHGTNRIGGNAIVDYLTFGREAGKNAAHAE